MGEGQGGLFRFGGLVALLETASVRHASENSGNEIRVVHVAEPGKHLVLVAGVQVHPAVKGIAMFIEFRRIGEIRKK